MKDGQIPTFADEFVEATLSEAKRQALSKLYSEATRGVRGTAVDLSFALGEDASPVVDKSRPYLDSLVGSSLAAELKAKRADGKHKADAVRVGEHLREVDKLVWPKDTFDRDRVAGFIVGGAKGGTSPVLVRTGGKLYVHTGAEMLAAKLVGGQKDVVVDVIDLDAWRRWDRPIPDAKTRIFASKHGLAIDELVVEAPAARAVDAARAAAARQAMGRLPVAVQRKAADAGAKLYIVAKLTDRLPHLKGQAPRGWPPGSTWDDLSGAGGRDATYAVGGRFGGRGPANVALHEWGHALDRMGQNRRGGGELFSSQAWWRDMWKGATTAPAPGGADALERWSKDRGGGSRGDYFRQAPPAGPSELWAEIIADAFETDDGRARVERHFPGMLARMGEEILRQLDLVPPE